MSSTPISSHIPQSLDIFPQLPPQLILNLHCGKLGGDSSDGFRGQGTNFCSRKDMEFREDTSGVLLANAIKGLQAFLVSVSEELWERVERKDQTLRSNLSWKLLPSRKTCKEVSA